VLDVVMDGRMDHHLHHLHHHQSLFFSNKYCSFFDPKKLGKFRQISIYYPPAPQNPGFTILLISLISVFDNSGEGELGGGGMGVGV
jgi:hypothetical protein